MSTKWLCLMLKEAKTRCQGWIETFCSVYCGLMRSITLRWSTAKDSTMLLVCFWWFSKMKRLPSKRLLLLCRDLILQICSTHNWPVWKCTSTRWTASLAFLTPRCWSTLKRRACLQLSLRLLGLSLSLPTLLNRMKKTVSSMKVCCRCGTISCALDGEQSVKLLPILSLRTNIYFYSCHSRTSCPVFRTAPSLFCSSTEKIRYINWLKLPTERSISPGTSASCALNLRRTIVLWNCSRRGTNQWLLKINSDNCAT